MARVLVDNGNAGISKADAEGRVTLSFAAPPAGDLRPPVRAWGGPSSQVSGFPGYGTEFLNPTLFPGARQREIVTLPRMVRTRIRFHGPDGALLDDPPVTMRWEGEGGGAPTSGSRDTRPGNLFRHPGREGAILVGVRDFSVTPPEEFHLLITRWIRRLEPAPEIDVRLTQDELEHSSPPPASPPPVPSASPLRRLGEDGELPIPFARVRGEAALRARSVRIGEHRLDTWLSGTTNDITGVAGVPVNVVEGEETIVDLRGPERFPPRPRRRLLREVAVVRAGAPVAGAGVSLYVLPAAADGEPRLLSRDLADEAGTPRTPCREGLRHLVVVRDPGRGLGWAEVPEGASPVTVEMRQVRRVEILPHFTGAPTHPAVTLVLDGVERAVALALSNAAGRTYVPFAGEGDRGAYDLDEPWVTRGVDVLTGGGGSFVAEDVPVGSAVTVSTFDGRSATIAVAAGEGPLVVDLARSRPPR